MTVKKIARVLLLSAAAAVGFSGVAWAEDYNLDPRHSFVTFKINHLGFSIMQGRFNDVKGGFSIDPANPANAMLDITVKTAAVDTNDAERDKHLRSKDFLEVDKYPTAMFKSTSVKANGNKAKVMGNLTLHGVTKPVTIDAEFIGAGKDPWGGYRRGYKGSTTIKRADFGMGYNLGPASASMELGLWIEGIRK